MIPFMYRLVYCLLWPICHLIYPMVVSGRENIPAGACIICANHSNYIDPLLLLYAFTLKNFLFTMSKKENMDLPVIGKIYKWCGAFPVERGSVDIKAVRTVYSLLKGGKKVVIFPEGTRTAVDNEQAGKSGAVRFAAKTQLPIVPVFITRGKRIFRRVKINIGAPYRVELRAPSEAAEETAALMRRIFALGGEP